MAGPITKQVKNPKPIIVNGRWVHKLFDHRPLTPEMIEHFSKIARDLKLHSA